MDMTRRVMTAPQQAASAAPLRPGAGPANRFNHVREFPGSEARDVVSPNADTLYSIAWLDLRAEPLVMSLPDMQGRWLLMQVLDAWTNVLASVGTRSSGARAQQYLISGPGWNGPVPEGMVHLHSPTPMSWLIGRTSDFPAVHRVQAQYSLVPLSRWLGGASPATPEAAASAVAVPVSGGPAVDLRTPVVTQVAQLGARQFFERLNMLMRDNPPAPADAAMLARLERLGIVPGGTFQWDALDANTRAQLEDAVDWVRGLFEIRSPGTQGPVDAGGMRGALLQGLSWLIDHTLLNSHNGWIHEALERAAHDATKQTCGRVRFAATALRRTVTSAMGTLPKNGALHSETAWRQSPDV